MTEPNNLVRLQVNGLAFGGWKAVRIEAGIERQARSFTLTITDRWPGSDGLQRRVVPGDACEVRIGDDLVLTGYVDATPISYDGSSVSVSVQGRSKTADLVDCCPITTGSLVAPASRWSGGAGQGARKAVAVPVQASAQWRRQRVETIAAALAAPYGVRVYVDPGVNTGAPVAEHHVQVGETVFESIDRLLRLRQLLSTDNATGDLVFIDVGSAGRASTALELGKNVLEGSAQLDFSGVFSEYICLGQRAGDDDAFGSDANEEEASTEDAGEQWQIGTDARVRDAMATRRRVLVIKQYGQADEGSCQDRADYERSSRRGKALQATYTVAGWRQADGQLWQPNQIVRVRDPLIGFDTEMLVAEVTYQLDDSGAIAQLRVGPVDGFRQKVSKPPKAKTSSGGSTSSWTDVK